MLARQETDRKLTRSSKKGQIPLTLLPACWSSSSAPHRQSPKGSQQANDVCRDMASRAQKGSAKLRDRSFPGATGFNLMEGKTRDQPIVLEQDFWINTVDAASDHFIIISERKPIEEMS